VTALATATARSTLPGEVQAALSRGGLVEITTTGRRTGRPRRIPIVFHVIGGRIVISGMPSRRKRAWLANLEADPRMTLHLIRGARADLPARARVISDQGERQALLAQVARAWRRDDVDTMVHYSPLIEVTLDEAPLKPWSSSGSVDRSAARS
jgi:deazaflavin-dependent oxidoreductase (nitroreductase family)